MLPWGIGIAVALLFLVVLFRVAFRRPPGPVPDAPGVDAGARTDAGPMPVPPARAEAGVVARLRIPVHLLHGRREVELRLAAFRPDGAMIAGVSRQTLRLFDGETGVDLTEGGSRFLPVGSDGFEALGWSRDGTRLFGVYGNRDDDILLEWDAGTGARTAEQTVTGCDVTALAPAPDGRAVAFLGGRAIGVWDPATGNVRKRDHESSLCDLAFVRHAGGRPAIVTIDNFYRIEHRDPKTLEPYDAIELETALHHLCLIDHGAVAVFAYGHRAELFDTASGRRTARAEDLPEAPISACAVAGAVVLGTADGRIVVCDRKTLEVVAEGWVDGRVEELAAGPDARFLSLAMSGSFSCVGEIWNAHLLRNAAARRRPS